MLESKRDDGPSHDDAHVDAVRLGPTRIAFGQDFDGAMPGAAPSLNTAVAICASTMHGGHMTRNVANKEAGDIDLILWASAEVTR